MLGVRADSAENNEGLGGEPGKVQVGKGADFDGGRLAVRVEGAAAVEDGLELGGGAAGDGPAEGGGEMAGDVLGRELAGVAWGVLVVLLGWERGWRVYRSRQRRPCHIGGCVLERPSLGCSAIEMRQMVRIQW